MRSKCEYRFGKCMRSLTNQRQNMIKINDTAGKK